MPRPKIFVGSSKEADEKDYGNRLRSLLEDDFEFVPWTESFKPMISNLDNIKDRTRECDGALFLFCADDQALRRDQLEMITRDNVVFETGFFMGARGIDRVLVVVEVRAKETEKVKLLSDLDGYGYLSLEVNEHGVATEKSFKRLARQIREYFSDLEMATGPSARAIEEQYGLSQAFAGGEKWIKDQRAALMHRELGRGGATKPIRIESFSLCMAAYVEALTRVQSTFRTTSLLSSGFWNNPSVEVIAANDRLMRRLKKQKGAVAQRLFLLDAYPGAMRDRWIELAESRRITEGKEGLLRFRNELRYLSSNIERLDDMGFETRIIYARDEHYTMHLPSELGFQAELCELAVYDDWRFDVFESKHRGLISDVRCYTPAMASFSTYINTVKIYYERLWADARPIESLLDVLNEAVEHVAERIDYRKNWLLRYEEDLEKNDQRLKERELEAVCKLLKTNGRWGEVLRFLDIGTCTGRYVLALRDALKPSGEIFGVDNDFDCVDFSKKKIEKYRSEGDWTKLIPQILDVDFQSSNALPFDGVFDLVTCMLGTLSHFGAKRRLDPPFTDPLQGAIRRMYNLLENGGELFLGVWTPYAAKNRKMLTIYQSEDLERLAHWTPSPEELGARLTQAGFEFQRVPVEERLDLYYCTKNSPVH